MRQGPKPINHKKKLDTFMIFTKKYSPIICPALKNATSQGSNTIMGLIMSDLDSFNQFLRQIAFEITISISEDLLLSPDTHCNNYRTKTAVDFPNKTK